MTAPATNSAPAEEQSETIIAEESKKIRQPIDEETLTRRVFIGNLSYRVDDAKLEEFFAAAGKV